MTDTRAITTAGVNDRRRLHPPRRPMTFRRFMRKYLVGIIAILESTGRNSDR